ncbi:hypothetical protein [Streptomyces sp. NPDC048410]|uniref:hypothetical protein n=1 Tax=Streptomyces sp. NPDC048410 TaxID=3365545 RepID=UPI0037165746
MADERTEKPPPEVARETASTREKKRKGLNYPARSFVVNVVRLAGDLVTNDHSH